MRISIISYLCPPKEPLFCAGRSIVGRGCGLERGVLLPNELLLSLLLLNPLFDGVVGRRLSEPNVFVRSELLLLLLFLPKPDDSNVVPWREPPKLLLPKSER